MKRLLIVLMLFISVSFAESFEHRNSCIPFRTERLWLTMQIASITPAHKLVLGGPGDKEFWFDFDYGLLSVGGNMKMTDGARLFIKYLVKEYVTEWIAMRDTIQTLRKRLNRSAL